MKTKGPGEIQSCFYEMFNGLQALLEYDSLENTEAYGG